MFSGDKHMSVDGTKLLLNSCQQLCLSWREVGPFNMQPRDRCAVMKTRGENCQVSVSGGIIKITPVDKACGKNHNQTYHLKRRHCVASIFKKTSKAEFSSKRNVTFFTFCVFSSGLNSTIHHFIFINYSEISAKRSVSAYTLSISADTKNVGFIEQSAEQDAYRDL